MTTQQTLLASLEEDVIQACLDAGSGKCTTLQCGGPVELLDMLAEQGRIRKHRRQKRKSHGSYYLWEPLEHGLGPQ